MRCELCKKVFNWEDLLYVEHNKDKKLHRKKYFTWEEALKIVYNNPEKIYCKNCAE